MERADDTIDTRIELPAASVFLLAKLAMEFPRLLVIRPSQECNVQFTEKTRAEKLEIPIYFPAVTLLADILRNAKTHDCPPARNLK